jgi:hypothetical protein
LDSITNATDSSFNWLHIQPGKWFGAAYPIKVTDAKPERTNFQHWIISKDNPVSPTAVFQNKIGADFTTGIEVNGSLHGETNRSIDLLGNARQQNLIIDDAIEQKGRSSLPNHLDIGQAKARVIKEGS